MLWYTLFQAREIYIDTYLQSQKMKYRLTNTARRGYKMQWSSSLNPHPLLPTTPTPLRRPPHRRQIRQNRARRKLTDAQHSVEDIQNLRLALRRIGAQRRCSVVSTSAHSS